MKPYELKTVDEVFYMNLHDNGSCTSLQSICRGGGSIWAVKRTQDESLSTLFQYKSGKVVKMKVFNNFKHANGMCYHKNKIYIATSGNYVVIVDLANNWTTREVYGDIHCGAITYWRNGRFIIGTVNKNGHRCVKIATIDNIVRPETNNIICFNPFNDEFKTSQDHQFRYGDLWMVKCNNTKPKTSGIILRYKFARTDILYPYQVYKGSELHLMNEYEGIDITKDRKHMLIGLNHDYGDKLYKCPIK